MFLLLVSFRTISEHIRPWNWIRVGARGSSLRCRCWACCFCSYLICKAWEYKLVWNKTAQTCFLLPCSTSCNVPLQSRMTQTTCTMGYTLPFGNRASLARVWKCELRELRQENGKGVLWIKPQLRIVSPLTVTIAACGARGLRPETKPFAILWVTSEVQIILFTMNQSWSYHLLLLKCVRESFFHVSL